MQVLQRGVKRAPCAGCGRWGEGAGCALVQSVASQLWQRLARLRGSILGFLLVPWPLHPRSQSRGVGVPEVVVGLSEPLWGEGVLKTRQAAQLASCVHSFISSSITSSSTAPLDPRDG